MRAILMADLQLDHTEKNGYRWEVFKWLFELGYDYEPDYWMFLGDIIDRKDNLPNRFTNNLVLSFLALQKNVKGEFFLLPGNHDFSDDPIHSILLSVKLAMGERAKFIDKDYYHEGMKFSANGHWEENRSPTGESRLFPQIVFLHETVDGAKADDMSFVLSSTANWAKRLEGVKHVFAGDIHGHQKIILPNKSETEWVYVGAPHHVRFGEKWTPGCILLDVDGDRVDWKFLKSPSKKRREVFEMVYDPGVRSDAYVPAHTFELDDHLEVRLNFQIESEHVPDVSGWIERTVETLTHEPVKVKVDAVTWQVAGEGGEIRETIENTASDMEVFDHYCEREALDSGLADAGRKYLDE